MMCHLWSAKSAVWLVKSLEALIFLILMDGILVIAVLLPFVVLSVAIPDGNDEDEREEEDTIPGQCK